MKCPMCKTNKIGKFYVVCIDCINLIIKNKLNFSLTNIPKDLTRICPSELIHDFPKIVVKDINENFQLLRDGYYTPSVLMSSRIFENMLFDYFDDEFFSEEKQNQNQWYDYSYQEQTLWDYSQWDEGGGINDDSEWTDANPSSLAGLIDSLNDYIPEEVIEKFIQIKDTRNEACHGNRRYTGKMALKLFKNVIKALILVYNGNLGILPEKRD